MSWNVLITSSAVAKVGQRAQEMLRRADCDLITPPKFGPLNTADLMSLLNGVDAVLASVDPYSAEVIESPVAARLKIISRWGVGYDSINLAAATKAGIVVTYTPGMLDDAVADYTFALLLALARRVHEGHLTMRAGEWRVTWGSDVSGKTLGIVGCGRIGQAVAQRASGFKMRVLSSDVSPSPTAEKLGVRFVSLDELLAESDYVSLHAALTPESRGLIGEAQLRKMKPTAYLINAGRGALVDEAALLRALEEGWIAGAALDTYVTEPLPAEHPLRRAPNVLLAPHQASFARETGERVSMAAAQAVVDLKDGKRPQHVLNPEVFNSASLRTKLKPSRDTK
ncbi:MAG: phosphoglycerate dehydrogenase [Verrucomicrobia bacterium]|nr:phosphoglycerate dehydrogenase [Verrucomicrobiota bacterium]